MRQEDHPTFAYLPIHGTFFDNNDDNNDHENDNDEPSQVPLAPRCPEIIYKNRLHLPTD
jgi:hypothetical protein